MTFESTLYSPEADEIVELFTLDASVLGASTYYFCSSQNGGAAVVYDGNTYAPIDVEATGFEYNGRGPLPEPTLRISNTTRVMGGLVIAYADLLGATLTRVKTFKAYLGDPSVFIATDIYKLEQKTVHNKVMIEWRCSAAMDHQGRFIPRRQAIRDICTQRYRRWTGSAFDYSKATCPYVGTLYFEADGTPTLSAAEDVCGKHLSDCEDRFGNDDLPTRAFPGIARTRVR